MIDQMRIVKDWKDVIGIGRRGGRKECRSEEEESIVYNIIIE